MLKYHFYGGISFFIVPFVINKPHHSPYLCTPSGNPSVRFVHSALFFLCPLKKFTDHKRKNINKHEETHRNIILVDFFYHVALIKPAFLINKKGV